VAICEHGSELSGSIKGEEFHDQLLKKHSVPWSQSVSEYFVSRKLDQVENQRVRYAVTRTTEPSTCEVCLRI
jgi:hypothetical protein